MKSAPRSTPSPVWILLSATVLLVLVPAGCVAPGSRGEPLVPNRYLTQAGPYRIWTNESLPVESPAPTELFDLHRQLESQLGLRIDPREAAIDVYILNKREAFEHLLTFYYPELPPRRAFFLAQGDRRTVFTYRSPHLVEDLRHEATHALLHVAVADLPLWLDEGLAEYFEVPTSQRGKNPEHLARLRTELHEGWTPDMARLEGLRDVRLMTARDYAEAWAWSHYLLRGPRSGRAELLGYLADLRSGKTTSPLSQRLAASTKGIEPSEQLTTYVEHVPEPSSDPPPIVATPTTSTIAFRGQNPPAEENLVIPPSTSSRAAPRRRSLLSRLAGLIGF